MADQDDIPVSEAMVEAGVEEYWALENRSHRKHDPTETWVQAIYRAMERVRRAEADADAIRRSVKP